MNEPASISRNIAVKVINMIFSPSKSKIVGETFEVSNLRVYPSITILTILFIETVIMR